MANYIQGISEISQGVMGLVEALKKVDVQAPFSQILKGVKDLGLLGTVGTVLKGAAEHVEKASEVEPETSHEDTSHSVEVESA